MCHQDLTTTILCTQPGSALHKEWIPLVGLEYRLASIPFASSLTQSGVDGGQSPRKEPTASRARSEGKSASTREQDP